MRFLTMFLLFLLASSAVLSQTISPTAEEYKGPHARGFFTLSNPSGAPVDVAVNAQGFTISATGRPAVVPLTADITVLIKKPAFKIGPHNTYDVAFEARCATLPCHFMLLSHFTPTRQASGLTIAVHLGGIVYVCEKQKNCRRDTLADLRSHLTAASMK